MSLANDQVSTLLLDASAEQEGHRRLALERASKAAWAWPVEAATVLEAGGSLTELSGVGPWVANVAATIAGARLSVAIVPSHCRITASAIVTG